MDFLLRLIQFGRPVEKRTALLALLVLCAACRDGRVQQPPPPPPPPDCGDGFINATLGEECEGSDLGGASCQSLGFDTGALVCGSDCRFLTGQCEKRCGNGTLDPGETCDGDAGVPGCPTFGVRRCTAACQVDSAWCVSAPLQAGAALQQTKGGPGVLADVSPPGPGDLVLAVPSFGRLATFPFSTTQGFTTGRLVSFSRTPVQPMAGDVDGDGDVDLAAINDDGSVDRFAFTGSAFALQLVPDGGVPATRWLGAGRGGDAGQALFALGGGDGGVDVALLVYRGGAAPTAALEIHAGDLLGGAVADVDGDGADDAVLAQAQAVVFAAGPSFDAGAPQPLPLPVSRVAAADLDGDGDVDLAAIEAGTGRVQLFENTGVGWATRTAPTSAAAEALQAKDLDLDGRPDLVWWSQGSLEVRRNLGGFAFQAYALSSGTGPLLSLSVGDLDGDGDLDFVTTHSAGGDATASWAVLNKVR